MHVSKTNPSSLPLVQWQQSEEIAERREYRKDPDDLNAPRGKTPNLSSRHVRHSVLFIKKKIES